MLFKRGRIEAEVLVLLRLWYQFLPSFTCVSKRLETAANYSAIPKVITGISLAKILFKVPMRHYIAVDSAPLQINISGKFIKNHFNGKGIFVFFTRETESDWEGNGVVDV